MQDQYNQEPEEDYQENNQEPVEIYSRWPIRLFSLFFSPIFGGVLLMINLRKAGFKQASVTVLIFSIVYTFVTSFILGAMGIVGGIIPILFNLTGGMILSDYFYTKYFPENDYYPRPIWGALAVALIIYLGAFLALYYTGKLPPEILKLLTKK